MNETTTIPATREDALAALQPAYAAYRARKAALGRDDLRVVQDHLLAAGAAMGEDQFDIAIRRARAAHALVG